MWKTIYKDVTDDWTVSVTHLVYGEGIKSEYTVFIKYRNNNWLWEDVKYNRHQLKQEICRLKKIILLDNRLKPSRIVKSR